MRWSDQIPSLDDRKMAWTACERAWLQHFRLSLGPQYWLAESSGSAVLSTLETNTANATLGYMDRTRKRILQVLDGIAQVPALGKDILIVFDDQENYYRYVSYYYPEGGEFAFSGGMHVSSGCGHFVTVKADLRSIEPVIAHEMTHGCVAHLPLPRWLDEGLAVNTERRLADSGPPLYTPQQMDEKHRAFWSDKEVQEFWSGESFFRADDGNLLSYDLARIMVEQMAKDWKRFKPFVLAADRADAGALAAREQHGVELDGYVCVLLGREPSSALGAQSGNVER